MLTEIISDQGQGMAVVYVPGIDGSGELLLGTARRLERHCRLLRARYVTGIHRHNDTYSHLARSLVEAIRMRGVESALLLAESFGGAVALRSALDHREVIRGLLLVNSFPYFNRRARLALSRLTTPLVTAPLYRLGRRLVGARVLFGSPPGDREIESFLGTTSGWSFDAGYRIRLAMIADLDLRPELGAVHQPVLIVTGSRDRIVDSSKQSRLLRERLPVARHVSIEGGGHLLLPRSDIDWWSYVRDLDALAREIESTPSGGAATD